MQDIKQAVEELTERLVKIKESFDLEQKKKELSSMESDSMDPNLWDDQEKARNLMQELSDLKSEIDELVGIESDLSTLKDLADQGELSADYKKEARYLEKRVEEFEIKSFLSGPYDKKNAMMTIHAGQGGTEAMDWSSMLYRMYLRYCERRNWKTEVLDISEGEEAGIKSVTFRVVGSYAYGYLRGESGTHRLVRQSPFNADRLRQTSFALVEVLPELEEIDYPDINLNDEDLDWQFFRASTQGGQNVQKVSTAVRLKHIPTDITVTAQTQRYQEANRKIALDLLRSKLWALEQKKKEEKVEEIKGEYHPASWGNQIRSYVLHPYKMVKDLRTEVETSDTEAVLDGVLDEFIDAELRTKHK
jgi:peptide chain release factor 2